MTEEEKELCQTLSEYDGCAAALALMPIVSAVVTMILFFTVFFVVGVCL